MEDIPMNIEQMIIATGSYLYNAGNSGNSIIEQDKERIQETTSQASSREGSC
jgi:hypothetical protein